MTPFTYPASLPCFRWEPYSVAPRPGSLEMTLGMQTHRAMVYTQNNEMIQCETILSSDQEQAFRTFFKTTLSMGTQWFTAPILRNGGIDDYEVMFLGAPPAYVPANKAGYVRARFTLLTRGDALPEGTPPVLDYDAIVLARSPLGYWRLDEASGTTFTDLTGNGHTVNYTGSGLTYANPTLNLDGGTSLFRDDSGANWYFGFDATSVFDADPDTPVTVGGWVKFANDTPTTIKTLFHIGGAGGGGQFTKIWAYRDATGKAAFSFHHLGGGTFFNTIQFTADLPLDTAFWFECGIDYAGEQFFFKLNNGAYEYIAFTSNTPNGIEPGRGTCTFSIGRRVVGNSGDPVNGYFSHFELYDSAIVALGMYPDWHL